MRYQIQNRALLQTGKTFHSRGERCIHWYIVPYTMQIAAMTSALANINKYMRRVYKSWRRGGHVILLGNVNHLNAKTFIDEV